MSTLSLIFVLRSFRMPLFIHLLTCLTFAGHPGYDYIGEKVSKALNVTDDKGVRDASVVVVGQGNVALDCARVLAKASPGLYDTDLAARALPVLGDGVSKISIVGRRGHIQGAFTIKEIRELVKLEEEGHKTSFIVRVDELDRGATSASQSELKGPQGRPKTRIDKLLRKAAATGKSKEAYMMYHIFADMSSLSRWRLFLLFQHPTSTSQRQ